MPAASRSLMDYLCPLVLLVLLVLLFPLVDVLFAFAALLVVVLFPAFAPRLALLLMLQPLIRATIVKIKTYLIKFIFPPSFN